MASVKPQADAAAAGKAADASRQNRTVACHICILKTIPNKKERKKKAMIWEGRFEEQGGEAGG